MRVLSALRRRVLALLGEPIAIELEDALDRLTFLAIENQRLRGQRDYWKARFWSGEGEK
jgi:hypothetical protein